LYLQAPPSHSRAQARYNTPRLGFPSPASQLSSRARCTQGRLALIVNLSTNNPYAKCAARNLVAGDTAIEYDIVCPGRASAKAHAFYTLNEGGFSGRIAMVLGGKNMTMTEVLHGRRIGACDYQSLKSVERF